MNSDFWTPRRVRILGMMWGKGRTAAQIAEELACTRDMVIGKAHREKLSPRPSPIKADPLTTEQRRRATRESHRFVTLKRKPIKPEGMNP